VVNTGVMKLEAIDGDGEEDRIDRLMRCATRGMMLLSSADMIDTDEWYAIGK